MRSCRSRARIKQTLGNWRVGAPTTIDDRDVQVVQGTSGAGTLATLYFDSESGLLVRMVRYADSRVGRLPTQFDYSDYRDVAGVKMPFKWKMTWLDGFEDVDADRDSAECGRSTRRSSPNRHAERVIVRTRQVSASMSISESFVSFIEEIHGRQLWDCRARLATACQLGSHADVSPGAGARAHEGARPRRDAVHVRRERPLPDGHADAGLEPPQARAPLRDALRRRSAGAVRAGRSGLPDRAPLAVDSEGERALLLRVDQGRRGAGLAPAGRASSPTPSSRR